MKYAIIGAGITGLMAAKAILDKDSDAHVIIIERGQVVGGLLSGIEYPEQELYFDLGTHIFQETGIAEIDNTLLNSIPPEDLIYFPLGQGDFAGSVFSGRLQTNTHFPDLNYDGIDEKVKVAIRKHIKNSDVTPSPIDRSLSLPTVANERFGIQFTEKYIAPIFQKVFKRKPEELSSFSLLLPGWTRVVIDNYDRWIASVGQPRYRALAAVPNQRDLPLFLHHKRRSFYSRRHGSRHVVESLAASLKARGVEFMMNASINNINIDFCELDIINSLGKHKNLTVDRLVIGTGVIGAAKLLKVDLSQWEFDVPLPYWITNIVIDKPCKSDLCYLYGLDTGCDWYRITNYAAFSGDVNDRRLTVETLGNPVGDLEKWPSIIVNQLYDIGLIDTKELIFSNSKKLANGYPSPTISNINSLIQLGHKLTSTIPSNIMLGGIGFTGGLFFQNEIVTDLYKRILNWD